MLQGFYSAASGMLMQQRTLNVISNNLANTHTAGYKVNRLISTTFEQALLTRIEKNNTGGIGTGEPARIVDEVVDFWTTGGFAQTSRPFDLGITRYGFFNVQAADGETYLTRNGQFDLDPEGYLELRDRGRVLDVNGQPIQVTISDIFVDEYGVIFNAGTGAEIAQLAITAPTADAVVQDARNGMYTADAVEPMLDPGVVQGAYERSNVSLVDEMSAMIIAQRNFSTASEALQFIDATYANAVNIASL